MRYCRGHRYATRRNGRNPPASPTDGSRLASNSMLTSGKGKEEKRKKWKHPRNFFLIADTFRVGPPATRTPSPSSFSIPHLIASSRVAARTLPRFTAAEFLLVPRIPSVPDGIPSPLLTPALIAPPTRRRLLPNHVPFFSVAIFRYQLIFNDREPLFSFQTSKTRIPRPHQHISSSAHTTASTHSNFHFYLFLNGHQFNCWCVEKGLPPALITNLGRCDVHPPALYGSLQRACTCAGL